jgi:hypothetical protein
MGGSETRAGSIHSGIDRGPLEVSLYKSRHGLDLSVPYLKFYIFLSNFRNIRWLCCFFRPGTSEKYQKLETPHSAHESCHSTRRPPLLLTACPAKEGETRSLFVVISYSRGKPALDSDSEKSTAFPLDRGVRYGASLRSPDYRTRARRGIGYSRWTQRRQTAPALPLYAQGTTTHGVNLPCGGQ